MVFLRYAPSCVNGEQWGTPEKLAEMNKAQRHRNKATRAKDPDAARERVRKWQAENRSKARAACQSWASRNKAKRKADFKEWSVRHPGRSKMVYAKHADTIKARISTRRKIDPVFALRCALRSRIRSALKVKGFVKSEKTSLKMLGCSLAELKLHLEQQFTSGMNWSNQGRWHIDHIVPCNIAQTCDEILALNHHSNLRPLWGKENLSKGASLPDSLPEAISDEVRKLWLRARTVVPDELPRLESLAADFCGEVTFHLPVTAR